MIMIIPFLIKKFGSRCFVLVSATFFVLGSGTVVYATHSWGNYHWAHTVNPFTLKLGDNVSTIWDAYLAEGSSDLNQSNILDTTVVAGNTDPRKCKPVAGRVEVCNAKYGFNGWLGLAQIWVSGNHIIKGVTKMNDSYFNTATYNTPAWRRFVMCQEIAHTFGLDHQDENFSNTNLGSCMDYTTDPDGPPSNEYLNAHDFEQLELIYKHFDSSTTVGVNSPSGPGKNVLEVIDVSESNEWGQVLRRNGKGNPSLYKGDLGHGEKILTFVFWADEK